MQKIMFLAMFLFSVVFLNASDFDSQKITRIDVVGNVSVSAELIVSHLESKVGSSFFQNTVDVDLKYIYSLGYFSDVSVEVDSFNGGVSITFVVEERFSIQSINITGNSFVKRRRILDLLGLKKSEVFDKKKLYDGITKIKKFYEEKGFSSVQIDPRLTKDNFTKRVTVLILIYEEDRFFIKEIILSGNEEFSDRYLRKKMKLKKTGIFNKGLFRENILKQDLLKIANLYKLAGYKNVVIKKEDVFYNKKNKKVTIVLVIEEGDCYRVGVIDFKGDALFLRADVYEVLRMKEGDPYSEIYFFLNQKKVSAYYAEKGYLYNHVKPEIDINDENHLVNITYEINKGEITYVERIIIQGNIDTNDSVIRRNLTFFPLEPFDGSAIKQSHKRIMSSGYFDAVDFETCPGSISNMRNLIISVKEKKTGEFSFGGGYSSIDKFVGFIDIAKHNFDLFDFPYFTGAGQKMHLRAEAGGSHRKYLLGFSNPWIFDIPLAFGFDLYRKEDWKTEIYKEIREGWGVNLGYPFSPKIRLSSYFKHENVDIQKIAQYIDADHSIRKEAEPRDSNTVGFFLLLQNNYPQYGHSHRFSFEPSGGLLGGDLDLLRFSYSFKFFYRLYQSSVFQVKMSASSVKAFSDTEIVPFYERLYAGGANTIRGYKDKSVGPSEQGHPVGGNSRLLLTAECLFPIFEQIKGALFVDSGNVWKEFDDWNVTDLKVGVGVGLRIKTQLGPMKLDYGIALDVPKQQDNTRVHFSIGGFF